MKNSKNEQFFKLFKQALVLLYWNGFVTDKQYDGILKKIKKEYLEVKDD